ncbi:Uncharacterised protein [Serratia quinivorans]|nr:Uncharacterised protein [Serratia quinivorans]
MTVQNWSVMCRGKLLMNLTLAQHEFSAKLEIAVFLITSQYRCQDKSEIRVCLQASDKFCWSLVI